MGVGDRRQGIKAAIQKALEANTATPSASNPFATIAEVTAASEVTAPVAFTKAQEAIVANADGTKQAKSADGARIYAKAAAASAYIELDSKTTGGKKATIKAGDGMTSADKTLTIDEDITASNVPSQAAAAGGAGEVLAAGGATKAQTAVSGVRAVAKGIGTAAYLEIDEGTGGGANKVTIKAADVLVGDKTVELDADLTASTVPSMAAAGGVDELVYTAAATRAQAKSGLTVAGVNNIPATITVTAGAESGDERLVTVNVLGLLGTNVAVVKHVAMWTAASAYGAPAAIVDTGITAVSAGAGIVDATTTTGRAEGLTSATGQFIFKLKHTAGAATCYVNAVASDVVASVDCSFSA